LAEQGRFEESLFVTGIGAVNHVPPEILFTPENNRDDPLPGHINRVLHSHGHVAVEFSGHDEDGSRYECILRLALHPEHQEVKGKFRSEITSNAWKDCLYIVEGRFQDRRFSTFEGTWRDPAGTCYVGIYDLPPAPKRAHVRRPIKSRKK